MLYGRQVHNTHASCRPIDVGGRVVSGDGAAAKKIEFSDHHLTGTLCVLFVPC